MLFFPSADWEGGYVHEEKSLRVFRGPAPDRGAVGLGSGLAAVGAERAAHRHHERHRTAGAAHPRRRRLRSVRRAGEGRSAVRRRPAGPLPGAARRRRRRLHGVQDRHLHHARPLGDPDLEREAAAAGSTATWRRSGRSRATGSRSPTAAPPTARPGSRCSTPCCAGSFIYVPGAGGSIFKVEQERRPPGRAHLAAFGPASTATPSPPARSTADAAGNVYYNVLKLNHGNPWDADVVNSWLVKVSPNGTRPRPPPSPR